MEESRCAGGAGLLPVALLLYGGLYGNGATSHSCRYWVRKGGTLLGRHCRNFSRPEIFGHDGRLSHGHSVARKELWLAATIFVGCCSERRR